MIGEQPLAVDLVLVMRTVGHRPIGPAPARLPAPAAHDPQLGRPGAPRMASFSSHSAAARGRARAPGLAPRSRSATAGPASLPHARSRKWGGLPTPTAALTRPDTPLPTIHAHPPFRPPSAADSGAAKSTGAAIQRRHGAGQGPGRGGPLRAGDRSGCGRRGWAARRAMRIARNAVPEV